MEIPLRASPVARSNPTRVRSRFMVGSVKLFKAVIPRMAPEGRERDAFCRSIGDEDSAMGTIGGANLLKRKTIARRLGHFWDLRALARLLQCPKNDQRYNASLDNSGTRCRFSSRKGMNETS